MRAGGAPPRYPVLGHPGPLPIAHRGGGKEQPENTWAAFSSAVDLGYDYLETDVHRSADGVVVVLHDPDLGRVAGRPGRVGELRWAEIARASVAGREPVPRFDELLAAWPTVRWNVDAKEDEVLEPLLEVIRRADAVDRVCVTAFSDARLERARRLVGPRLCTSLGPGATAALRLASVVPACLRTAPPGRWDWRRAGAAQVPRRWGAVPVTEPRFVRAAQRDGLAVHVWTVDDPADMARLLDLGVDGIMTDRPSVLKEVLQGRGQWHGAR